MSVPRNARNAAVRGRNRLLKRIASIALVAAAAVALTAPEVRAQAGGYGPGMMGGYGWGGGWWGLGMVGMLLWWVLIILGIVLLAKWIYRGTPADHRTSNRAIEILRERYARGEIDKKEFEERKRDLGS